MPPDRRPCAHRTTHRAAPSRRSESADLHLSRYPLTALAAAHNAAHCRRVEILGRRPYGMLPADVMGRCPPATCGVARHEALLLDVAADLDDDTGGEGPAMALPLLAAARLGSLLSVMGPA